MLRFLSRFSLTTRIYTGFFFLGIYVVLVCFASVLAVGYVHKEYARANNVIENTRQIAVLENNLFALNRSLYFFAMKETDEEKSAVEEAFALFDEKAKEVETYLETSEVREKYTTVINTVTDKYRADMTEMFSLHEKSVAASEKVNRLAEKASNQLNALVEETSLPSASFALNGLREQLDAVLQAIDAATAGNAESQKRLNSDFAALKKAQNSARQAEMINTKQLKNLINTFNGLEEEINRKLKIDKMLREKMNAASSFDGENSKDIRDLLNLMAQSCTQLLSQTEAMKILLQRLFVLAAAIGGILAVVLSFLSLFGIRYPLSRLIENAREMARGEPSILIHFTERDDEIGSLAKALAALLVRLRERPALSADLFRNYQNVTAGSGTAYAPTDMKPEYKKFGSKEAQGEDEFAYFGEGVGVDTESQLYQMLYLVQHIGIAASDMTKSIKKNLSDCRGRLQNVKNISENIKELFVLAESEEKEIKLSEITAEITGLMDAFAACFPELDEIQSLFLRQNVSFGHLAVGMKQAQNFIARLTEWGRVAAELTGMIHSLSAETKILSLNASIEAAKLGETAKDFGSVSLDMRHKTAETAGTAERLSSHLVVAHDEVVRFAENINALGARIEEAHQCLQTVIPAQTNHNERIKAIFDAIGQIRDEMGGYVKKKASLNEKVSSLTELADKTAADSDLNRPLDEIERKINDFNLSLPTYEEDKG